MNKFAILLRQLRESKKLSQRRLSEHLGLSPMMVRDYENGSKLPKTRTTVKIANFFLLPYSELENTIYMSKWHTKKHIITK